MRFLARQKDAAQPRVLIINSFGVLAPGDLLLNETFELFTVNQW